MLFRSKGILAHLTHRARSAGTVLQPPLQILKDAASGWQKHKAGRVAAAIAYHGIFSLAPLIVIMVSVAGLLFGQEAAEGLVVGRIEGIVGEEVAGFIESLLAEAYVAGGSVVATIIAVALLLFGASRVIGGLRGALNDIWGVEARAGGGIKGFVLTKLFDLGMVLVMGFMFLATMLASAAASVSIHSFADALPIPGLAVRVGSVLFSLLVVVFFIAMVFRVLPNIRVPWRDILVGSAVTAVLFSIGNYVIGIYLGRASVDSVFAGAGSLVVLMIWIYYSTQIILFGAEITRAHCQARADDVGAPEAGTEGPKAPGTET